MTMKAPLSPRYGSGVVVNPAAASANTAINSVSRQVCLTNLGANICYVRVSNDATDAATTADYPVPAGAQVIVTKNDGQDRIAYISASGTSLHIMTGEGW